MTTGIYIILLTVVVYHKSMAEGQKGAEPESYSNIKVRIMALCLCLYLQSIHYNIHLSPYFLNRMCLCDDNYNTHCVISSYNNIIHLSPIICIDYVKTTMTRSLQTLTLLLASKYNAHRRLHFNRRNYIIV